ncbi:MAG: 50S ribosomal protein L11 methyltransferase [Marinilabiliales bacterium]
MDYLEYIIEIENPDNKEIIIALLNNLGFNGFIEENNIIKAYTNTTDNKVYEHEIQTILKGHKFIINRIKPTNWNKLWESSYNPVVIDNNCVIRASFHNNNSQNYEYDIIIDPKMAFGTAHHETTQLMISSMMQMDFSGKKVADIGCGTGILSILAEKKGAKKIDAVDIDEAAYKSCIENINSNKCIKIQCLHGNIDKLSDSLYDIILANINRNTIIEQLPEYSKLLSNNGSLLISGIFKQDMDLINPAAIDAGFILYDIKEKNNWVSVLFIKNH